MSKRVFHHPPEAATGRKYWRSLAQAAGDPSFNKWLEREFPQGAAEFQGGETSRRSFIQLMGASMALAGLSFSSCRRPEKHLVPFTKGVEWNIPGKALFFATSRPTRRGAEPLVVATYEGRPTKIEGNPLHPVAKGASSTWAQSSILDLYDPDRARTFRHNGQEVSGATFEKALDEIVAGARDGAGLAFLMEKCASPTRDRLRAEIEKKFGKAAFYTYDACEGDQKAHITAFGTNVSAAPRFENADVVMALDCDFLSCTEGSLDQIRAFTARRAPKDAEFKMNRLYVVENRYTVTGGMADHRLRVPASQVGAFLSVLAGHIGKAANSPALTAAATAARVAADAFNEVWVREAAADLVAAKGKSLVLVGERQPAAVQALGHAINAALGNIGATIVGRKATERPAGDIGTLARVINDGTVKVLFILGGNPVYNAPSDLDWANTQKKVQNVIRLGLHEDETSAIANWVVPAAHYLESWGDGIAADGSYTAVQPMILPLYDGWSELDIFAKVLGQKKPEGPELVQETFRQQYGANDFVPRWAKFLRDGFLEKSAPADQKLTFNADASGKFITENIAAPATGGDAYEIVLVPDSKVDDGRYANNGWMQELPDPITKVTWDNCAWISPTTAKKLGVLTDSPTVTQEPEDNLANKIRITVENRSIEIPVLVAPGHAENSITIPLGYGRKIVGRVGTGTGFDAYPLRTSKQPFIIPGAKVEKAEGQYKLAVTQEHGALEGRGADITRESNFDKFKEVAGATPGSDEANYYKKLGMDAHIPKNVSLYNNPPQNDVYSWGMAIDMSSCTGCSACMVACQAENNVPIVGKGQVINNREMHWLRMDRYFATDDGNFDEPEMVSQPMLCQHCENAPCETVCPVNATVHSEDGLNVMAYNRCIGTRYCANNCPFKVRRFNFFDYNRRDVLGDQPHTPWGGHGLYQWNLISDKGTPETLKMQKNPNVTVRMRGVMEKCTFCVQRIQEAKIATKAHARQQGVKQTVALTKDPAKDLWAQYALAQNLIRKEEGKEIVEVKEMTYATDDVLRTAYALGYRKIEVYGMPKIPTDSFTVACAQACPSDSIVFGDIKDPKSRVSQLRERERGYRLLEYLNVNTHITYLARIRNPNPKMPDATKMGSFIKAHGHGHGDKDEQHQIHENRETTAQPGGHA